MCARYTLRTPLNLLVEEFQLGLPNFLKTLETVPRYNVAPTQTVVGAKAAENGGRELALFHWGLIPSWAKDKKIARSTINARGDTAATKPAFRTAFKKRRCLVIADGYYEWKAEGKVKIPYLYEIDDGKPFAFAGLWETWYGEDHNGPPLESCTLVTTEANSLASELHDRMPVVLQPQDYDRWLDPKLQDAEEIMRMISQFPVEQMSARRLESTFVNNARNEGPECLAGEPMAVFRKELKTCTLRANCIDALSLQADWLLNTVAEYEGIGKGLADRVIVHLGWSLLQLRADGNELAICEPDFSGNALREFRDDVTAMLTVLLFQRELMTKVGISGDLIRHDEKVVLKSGVLQNRSIYMERQQTKPGDSGWYIGPVKGDPAIAAELEAKWVFQLLADRPRLLDVMLLPVGSLVIWDGDQIIGIQDPDGHEIWNTEPSI